ncbi:MAG: uvra3 [Chlamydiales bacterium]|nr:uvra3 [Chlamydiales bacterium]
MHPSISLKKVSVHNLKSVDLILNPNELIVFCGVSGSGKSSLAFDTIYAEGQRRYVESLSTFARRYLGDLAKPEMESAEGLSPTISIEQKTAGKTPRSTVGTLTEIYDYLRVLFARVATPHCPVSGEPVAPQSREKIIRMVQSIPIGTRIIVLAPYARSKKGEFREDFEELQRKGFMRARVDDQMINLDESIALDGKVAHNVDIVIDRLKVDQESMSRIAEALTQALEMGKGLCSVVRLDSNQETLYSMHAYSPASGLSYPALEPHDFSFNSPSGMCTRCEGLGTSLDFDFDKMIDPNLSIAEDCCALAKSYTTILYGNIYDNLARLYDFKVSVPWKKLSEEAKNIFLYGAGDKRIKMRFKHPERGIEWTDFVVWKGVLQEIKDRYTELKTDKSRKKIEEYMSLKICSDCKGGRLKPYPMAAKLAGKNIAALASLSTAELYEFMQKLQLPQHEWIIAEELVKEITLRLHFLLDVGLNYLSLDRTAPTLSGGESQRVRLAAQIGCGLVGVTYVLDEPSIGLHPRDNHKLIQTLKHLRDAGNTVIVVEHDEETLWEADRIVDFGPGAGQKGGEIIVNGDLQDLLENPISETGGYLSGRKAIAIPKKRRKATKEKLKVCGAQHHNLKNIDVEFPLGLFVVVAGVSGSGKSSLVSDILHPALAKELHDAEQPVGKHREIQGIEYLDKVIAIDQSPIGRNPRSNPATYIKLLDEIRDLLTQVPDSAVKGYKAGRFSFNVKEGSCTECEGMGMLKIDMDFMEDAWVTCSLCQGKRFDEETLSIKYKDKNIYGILEMTVDEALAFFDSIPSIKSKLQTLERVGLNYLKIGQPSPTLSGGEAQRIKLAKELVRPATGRTIYILDEPTTGLHFKDINLLLQVLHELVNRGNTVLVIEHNMDVVKTADWIIEIGPEGGASGGQLIAKGTPEQIAKLDTATGKAVAEALYAKQEEKIAVALKKCKERRKQQKKGVVLVESPRSITVKGAEQNNLKHLDLEIPREQITVCTGPSGSGKSSFAFDTIYAEGQRRYIESLSPYARQFVKQMPKPKVQQVEGLSPAVAIEQKAHAGNPRSTIGTMTEIYDYLRVLYSQIGIPHCPETGEEIRSITKEYVIDRVMKYPNGSKIQVLAPIELKKQDKFLEVLEKLRRQGYLRIRLNGEFYDLDSQQEPPFDRRRRNELYLVIDRLKIAENMRKRLFEAVETAARIGNQQLLITQEDGEEQFFNLAFAVVSTGKAYPPITPQTFAFNTQAGMCPACLGLGIQYGANLFRYPELIQKTLQQLLLDFWYPFINQRLWEIFYSLLEKKKLQAYSPVEHLTTDQQNWLMNGADEKDYVAHGKKLRIRWRGINQGLARAARTYNEPQKEAILPLLEESNCSSCQGSRLHPLARHVTLENYSIADLCNLPIQRAKEFLENIKLTKSQKKLLEEVQRQLILRLGFLCEIGLHYLTLSRRAPTLSGGEAQRIRLATQLGSGLTGVLYVLDEPTIGLHPQDNELLNQALRKLKDLGNTLLLVEHDPLTVTQADYILDFGPQSGNLGGYVTAQGSLEEICQNPNSLTGAYLSGTKTIPKIKKRHKGNGRSITISRATLHNLKDITVEFPLGLFSCITGVSGSGKSTLMHQILNRALQTRHLSKEGCLQLEGGIVEGLDQIDKVIVIDQSPIGHTARSDVGTYSELLSVIRDIFANLPEAAIRGLKPGNFSFNHRKGMCSRCFGLGYRKIQMHFLPEIKVQCEDCQGLRLNPLSLKVTYKGKNFGELLKLTIDQTMEYFSAIPTAKRILQTLIDVGLGYLTLGQEVATLSGGEAQRLRLSRDLAKRSKGHTLYLLDEPTTGLHADDTAKLLKIFDALVAKGHTLIIIEHNVDVIKSCDYLVDLGPAAGEEGGYVLFAGTPEDARRSKRSVTGKYLR